MAKHRAPPPPTDPLDELVEHRAPEAVPTPLAIALADFCRRAGRPSAPEAVRHALARLHPEEDERFAAFAGEKPPGRPLGPEAAVDVFRGLPALEASAREESGFYVAMAQVPRERVAPADPNLELHPRRGSPLAKPTQAKQDAEDEASPAPAHKPRRERAAAPRAARASKAADLDEVDPEAEQPLPDEAPSGPTREEQAQEIFRAVIGAKGDLEQTASDLGLSLTELNTRMHALQIVRKVKQVAEKATHGAVAPTVRKAGTPVREKPKLADPVLLPKRGAGRPPRGRMAQGPSAAMDPAELSKPAAKADLRDLLATYKGNQPAVLDRLNLMYRGTKGPLTPEFLTGVLQKHELLAEADRLERDNFRILFMQQKGQLGKVARTLNMKPRELTKYLKSRDMWDDAEKVRARFRRELFGRAVSDWVQVLLHKQSYAADLGVEDELEVEVQKEVRAGWVAVKDYPEAARPAQLATRLNIAEENAALLIARYKLG
jgi:hypothetical protein